MMKLETGFLWTDWNLRFNMMINKIERYEII